MKYILEIRRPSEYDTVPFAEMVRSYVSLMSQNEGYDTIEFFDTITERAGILKTRPDNDGDAIKAIHYNAYDVNAEGDYYYASVDIPKEYEDLFHEGRGALIPRFSDDKTTIVTMDYVRKGGQ